MGVGRLILSVVSLVITGVVLMMIPVWMRAYSSWEPLLAIASLVVVGGIGIVAVLVRKQQRWLRVLCCGACGGCLHVVALNLHHQAGAFEWLVIWSIYSGSLLVAVVGGALVGAWAKFNRSMKTGPLEEP